MATRTAFCNAISTHTGGEFAAWDAIQNIRNDGGNYAVSKLIKTKSQTPNRPGVVRAKDFKLNLPTGAKVTSIRVEYNHDYESYNGKYPSIPAPYITLDNIEETDKVYQKKGVAAKPVPQDNSVTFTPINSNDFTISKLNSPDFGVIFNYSANTSKSNSGYLRIKYIRLVVEYREPAFSVNWESTSTVSQGDNFNVNLTVSNTNLVDYQPTYTVLTPAGFSLKDTPSGDGTWVKIENRKYTWTPNFDSNKGSISLGLSFVVSVTGTLPVTSTFEAINQLTDTNTTKNITVTEKSSQGEETSADTSQGIDLNPLEVELEKLFVKTGERFFISKTLTDEEASGLDEWDTGKKEGLFVLFQNPDWDDDYTEYYDSDIGQYALPWDDFYEEYIAYFDADKNLMALDTSDGKLGINDVGKYTIVLAGGNILEDDYIYADVLLNYCNIEVYPEGLEEPSATILCLGQEELDRLGDGYTYTVETLLKVNTTEDYVRNWGKNFRIGVFNNPISSNITNYTYVNSIGETNDVSYDSTNYDTLTVTDIINNAEYWSDLPGKQNVMSNLTCNFPYNQNYPLYIIITGDYSEYDGSVTINFTEPNLIETEAYNGRETNGNYPIPIRNILTTNSTTCDIGSYEQTAPVILYDLDLDTNYGTNEHMAVRGIGVQLSIDDYEDSVLSVQLRSPTGATGERSVNLEQDMMDENNNILVGGIGDTWNFNTKDLVNLEDWEVQLTIHNILTETDISINYHTAQIIFYFEEIETQTDYCYINGEDIRYYGAFVKDIDIPSGLKMSTSYLNVDGTDTNDAYRQNIREKEITLELEIGDNCDLKTATDSLRQLTQLILNERDKYNRPIPKRISFSFMPDIYFEYIVEDVFDNPIEISSYNIKVKLVVPSGTAFKTRSTTTNTTGYVQGLAKVNPIISIKPIGVHIEVLETISNQKFNITLPETTDDIIIIDTSNRRCSQQEEENSTTRKNITRYVDFNSDWFTLQGQYNFTSTNCYIRSVEYTERW